MSLMRNPRAIENQRMAPTTGNEAQRILGEASTASGPSTFWLVALILAHIPLAMLLWASGPLAGLHAAAVVIIGLAFAAFRPLKDMRVLWVVAYIVGAESLWRSTGAANLIAWEMGKYSVVVILGIYVLRRYRRRSLPTAPVAYMLCLIPALALFFDHSLDMIWRRAVGNLAGPLTLTICAIAFSRLKLSGSFLQGLAVAVIAPAVSSATIVGYNSLLLQDSLYFGASANRLASGGGPNQVANAIALGALFCWLLLIQYRGKSLARLVLLAVLCGMILTMMLTFSRGGVYTFALCVAGSLPFIAGRSGQRWSFALPAIFMAGIYALVIWPWVDSFTAGSAAARFLDLDSTRWDLAESELQVWLENPIAGVGPGLAREEVTEYLGFSMQAHVEYTRLLAEHGLFGLLALGILVFGAVRNFRNAPNWEARVWVIGLLVFSFAYMAQSATRTAAPGFVYGITWAILFAPDVQLTHVEQSRSSARPSVRPSPRGVAVRRRA